MKSLIFFGLIFITCMHVDASSIDHTILTSSMVYNGQVEDVRSALGEYLESQQLEKFMTVVHKFRSNAPREESRSALKELIALVYASFTATSEADWLKVFSGDNSILTADEIEAIDLNRQQNPNDKWRLLKKLAQLRMNADDANHITDILTKIGGNVQQFARGRRELVIAALAAVSNKSETEATRWIS